MKKLKVPEGMGQVSHVNEIYFPDENGFVYVSDEAAEVLTTPIHGLVAVDDVFEIQVQLAPESPLAVNARARVDAAVTKVALDAATPEKEA